MGAERLGIIPRAYLEGFALPQENYVLVEDVDFDWRHLERGVLFVMASWSGASQVSFRTLNAALANCPEATDIRIYIFDTDTKTADRLFASMSPIGEVRRGYGETFWIKQGQIDNSLARYSTDNLSVVETYIRSLFR